MKKLLLLGSIFALFTVAASAQQGKAVRPDKHRIQMGQVTPGERARMHKNRMHLKKSAHKYKRDGKVSPMERKLHKMKQHNRRMNYRFHHNNRQRS